MNDNYLVPLNVSYEHCKYLKFMLMHHDDRALSMLKISLFSKMKLFRIKYCNEDASCYCFASNEVTSLLNLLCTKFDKGEINKLNEYYDCFMNFAVSLTDPIINSLNLKKSEKALIFFKKYGENRSDLIEPKYSPKISIDFIKLHSSFVLIEGSFDYCIYIMPPDMMIQIKVNNEELYNIDVKRRPYSVDFMGTEVMVQKGFSVTLKLSEKISKYSINFILKSGEKLLEISSINFRKFAPVSKEYRYSYYSHENWLLMADTSTIYLYHRKAKISDECKFLCEIWKKNRLGGRKAIALRAIYHILNKFSKNKIWIFTDKADRADDNAECLLDYISENNLAQNIKCYFAISKKSSDYIRLKKKFHVVPYLSYRHKLLILLSEFTISGYIHEEVYNPFFSYNAPYRDLLQSVNYVFLDHGIKKDNLETSLNRFSKNMKLMVCSSAPEYQSVLSGNYGYTSKQVCLTGLCRYDRLYNDSSDKRIITIMPTWRSYLTTNFIRKDSKFILTKDFKNSNYYKFYINLLTSSRLMEFLEGNSYQIYFVPHPTMFPYAKYFDVGSHVKVWGTEVIHRDIYAASKLLVTDYSSVAFDFVRLYKPVFYCQFDSSEFYGANGHRKQSYFNYETDGFGEVEYSLEGTIDRIIEYVSNECKLKDKYRKRIDRFFPCIDHNNCERVYSAIRSVEHN